VFSVLAAKTMKNIRSRSAIYAAKFSHKVAVILQFWGALPLILN